MENIKEKINEYILIFLFGGFVGWLIELLYRFLFLHQIVNPGFLSGPYLPIYGFGLVLLTIILNQKKLNWFLKIFIFAVSATLMELVSGWFFQQFFHLHLWDYSTEWGNWHGWICPRFFLYWFIAGLIYYLFFYKKITKKAKHDINSRPRLIVAYILISLFFIDITHAFYSAHQIGSNWMKEHKKTLPILSEYKIFEPDRATNFLNSIGQSIKNYTNYKLPDKILKNINK